MVAALGAWRVILAARAVRDAAEDKDTYGVLFITDEGMRSDSAKIETRLNKGLVALGKAESEATVLLAICGVLGLALAWRLVKGNRPSR